MARPRSEEARRSALAAAVSALVDSGVEGVTLEEVAQRSGVARSTLYRHFGNKESLLLEAVRSCQVDYPTPDSGDLHADLTALLGAYRVTEQERQIPDLLPILIDEASRDRELQAIVDELIADKRRPLRTVLKLAQLRGEIDPDLDLDLALVFVIGPITHRKMIERRPITPEYAAKVVDLAVKALRQTAPASAS